MVPRNDIAFVSDDILRYTRLHKNMLYETDMKCVRKKRKEKKKPFLTSAHFEGCHVYSLYLRPASYEAILFPAAGPLAPSPTA